jgi:hypothetical protein
MSADLRLWWLHFYAYEAMLFSTAMGLDSVQYFDLGRISLMARFHLLFVPCGLPQPFLVRFRHLQWFVVESICVDFALAQV